MLAVDTIRNQRHADLRPHEPHGDMSISRRDGVIAVLVGFVAYAVAAYWISVVRYVAYAFVAGALSASLALTALVLLTSRDTPPEKLHPHHTFLSVALTTPSAWKEHITALRERAVYSRASLYAPSFAISDGLDDLLDLVLRDFVTAWYGHISPRPSFTNQVDKLIRVALSNLRDRTSSVDLVEMTVSRLVPIINGHLKGSYDAEKAVRGLDLNRDVTESDELDRAIAGKYCGGKLHPAASLSFSDPKMVQQDYLRGLSERLLSEVLPESQTKSRVFEVLLREIIACAVLAPLVQILADPDTWNQIMEAYVRPSKRSLML